MGGWSFGDKRGARVADPACVAVSWPVPEQVHGGLLLSNEAAIDRRNEQRPIRGVEELPFPRAGLKAGCQSERIRRRD